jgi:predicted negative regulator of RcsB-dependent stress response
VEDLHEEEQLERLRDWWRRYGKAVIAGVIAAIVAAVAVQSWRVNQRSHQEAASAEYSQMLNLVDSDAKQAMGVAERLVSEYDDTVYASLASLLHARLSADKGDWDGAAKQYQWVLDNGDEEGLVHIARLRLARVMLQQGQADKALALLKGVDGGTFDSQYDEIRGDAHLAQGQKEQAREAYAKALANASLQRDTRMLQMKMDDLAAAGGEAKP